MSTTLPGHCTILYLLGRGKNVWHDEMHSSFYRDGSLGPLPGSWMVLTPAREEPEKWECRYWYTVFSGILSSGWQFQVCLHGGPVGVERLPSSKGEFQHGVGFLPDELLLHLHVSRLLEF